jgi:hypothetical protein
MNILFVRHTGKHISSITLAHAAREPHTTTQRRYLNKYMSTMAVTLLTMPEDCRNRILHFCLLQPTWVVVDSSKPDAPGLLRTCTQLRKEGTTMFYRENTFLLILENLALPQGHWIHWVAEVSNKPVITRIRERKEPPGSPQKWLSAFYNDKTRIQWVPFRPGSASRSRHPLVNVLRYGFLIASLLKAQRRKNEGAGDDEEDKQRQRSAELMLEVWCETAETAERSQTLRRYLRGCDKEFYTRTMESFDRYHYSPRNGFSPEGTHAKTMFEGAFGIIDIMQDDDWQVVQQVLGYWIQTVYTGSAQWLFAGGGKSVATERCGPRRQDPHWLRERKRTKRQERFA